MGTIAAVSTPLGRAALAIIRMSGPLAKSIALELCGTGVLPVRSPRVYQLKSRSGKILDEAMLSFFEGPNSFTGEDLVEIYCHGNPIIVGGILNEIVSRETVRMADPGEFSRRALANGRMSLDSVEALDLILNAENPAAVRLGLEAKLGGLRNKTEKIKESLLNVFSELEAQLDFQENEVGSLKLEEVAGLIKSTSQELKTWELAFERNRIYLESTKVALIGKPNAGKSSLFNRIIGQDKAIVHESAGTTRDFLEHRFELEGIPILLWDTAGLRKAGSNEAEPVGSVESIGIERTLERIREAHVLIWVDDSGAEPAETLMKNWGSRDLILVLSKSDLWSEALPGGFLPASAKTGDGIDEILRRILRARLRNTGDEGVPIITERQMGLVSMARQNLDKAVASLEAGVFLDQVTEQIRSASEKLGELIQAPASDDILKSIFSRFCIGK